MQTASIPTSHLSDIQLVIVKFKLQFREWASKTLSSKTLKAYSDLQSYSLLCRWPQNCKIFKFLYATHCIFEAYFRKKYSVYIRGVMKNKEIVLCSKMDRSGGISLLETSQAQRQFLHAFCYRWELGNSYLKIDHAHKDDGCWF